MDFVLKLLKPSLAVGKEFVNLEGEINENHICGDMLIAGKQDTFIMTDEIQ